MRLEPYKDAEIISIVCQRYPNFGSNKIADKLLEIYKSLNYSDEPTRSNSSTDQSMAVADSSDVVVDVASSISFVNFRASFAKEGRFLSLRDLLKLCNRLVGTKLALGPDQQRHLIVTLLSDLYECFLCFISNTAVREELAIGIGCKLNINKDEVFNQNQSKRKNFN